MRFVWIFIWLCLVAGCGRGHSLGKTLTELDPGDPTPPVLMITDTDSVLFNLAYSPDGKCLAAGSKHFHSSIRVWDAATGQQLLEIHTNGRAVVGLGFIPDGSKLVGALEGGNGGPNLDSAPIVIWDSKSGEMLRMFESGFLEMASLAMSRDGRLVASAGPPKFVDGGGTPESPKQNYMEASIKVWELETENLVKEFTMRTAASVTSLEFSADAKSLACGSSGSRGVSVCNLSSGELVNIPVRGHFDSNRQISSLAYSPDGEQLACGHGRYVTILSTKTGEELMTLGKKNKSIMGGHLERISFSPDGKRLAASSGFGVHVWDLNTGRCLRTLKDLNGVDDSRGRIYGVDESPYSSREVIYSPDGRHIACEFWKIIVWETK